MEEKRVIEYNKARVYTGKSTKGYGHSYFAKRNFSQGEVILVGFGRIVKKQTAHCSVQIGPNKHYLPSKWTGKYWNHSCNPNTFIRTGKNGFPKLVALKKIKKNEEITYAYWMTEYEWHKKADENWVLCKCGDAVCRGKILSFSQLTKTEQINLKKKGLISAHLFKN